VVFYLKPIKNRLFGSDLGRESTTLVAPSGTAIMAFYGSIGRLFETIGCYVVVNENNKGNRNQNKSGVKKLNVDKNKIKRHQSQQSAVTEEEGDGAGGTTFNSTNSSNKRRKSKRKKNKYQNDDDDDDDDGY